MISDCSISKKKKRSSRQILHVSSLTTGSPLQKQQEKVKSQQLKQYCIKADLKYTDCIITAWARSSGIPAVRSCIKRCFLCLSEALSWSSMALKDCLFFSFLERHSRWLMMCSSNVGTGKSPDWSDFHPCGVASLLQSLRVSRLDLSSARATFQRNNKSHAGGKMLVWIIATMERRVFVFKKKKKKKRKEKSASPGSDLRGPVAGCIDGWAMYRN